MKLVLDESEVRQAVAEYLRKQGFDFDPNVLKVEFDYEGDYDEQRAVGVSFSVELKGGLALNAKT